MRTRTPSPSMAVAVAAVVLAGRGSAVAAVDFARNAGAVDGRSAVSASKKVINAHGKLVATARSGPHPGKFPNKFLADTAKTTQFALAPPVNDNAGGAPVGLGSSPIGNLTAACNDQAAKAGVENPSTTLTLSNPSPAVVNFSRDTGSGDPTVSSLAPGTVHTLGISGNNTFRIRAQQNATQGGFDGFVRQDGAGTAAATGGVAGTTEPIAA